MHIGPRTPPTVPGEFGVFALTGGTEPRTSPPTFGDLLRGIHGALRKREGLTAVTRIGVASYDAPSDMLKTFASTDGDDGPLQHYQYRLARLPALQAIAKDRCYRHLPDLGSDALLPGAPHTEKLVAAGVRSSLTVPIHWNADLLGFIFFDSAERHLFTDAVRDRLWPYAHLIVLMMINEREVIRIVRAATRTVQEFARYKDPETSAHLQRMAHLGRIIASDLAPRLGLSDEFIEHLFWFAPLHDIGKVGVPDAILLKPGKLTAEEYTAMKRHVDCGVDIVDRLSGHFGLAGRAHVAMMRNVIACHHEALDGSGYPAGLAGDAIPLEGRIIAVADVFDALTSVRPYKPRWDNRQALEFMQTNRGTRFDAACVDALTRNMSAVVTMQRKFADVLDV